MKFVNLTRCDLKFCECLMNDQTILGVAKKYVSRCEYIAYLKCYNENTKKHKDIFCNNYE